MEPEPSRPCLVLYLQNEPLPCSEPCDLTDATLLCAGFCTAYLVFIKENLASFTGQPANLCVTALLPFLLALSALRGVAALAPFSLIADVANFIGATPVPS